MISIKVLHVLITFVVLFILVFIVDFVGIGLERLIAFTPLDDSFKMLIHWFLFLIGWIIIISGTVWFYRKNIKRKFKSL
jgi:hypothetical protein